MKKSFYCLCIVVSVFCFFLLTACDSLIPYEFSLEVAEEGNGSGSIGPASTADGIYGGNTEITAVAVANTGSVFRGWYDKTSGGSLVSTENPYTFSLHAITHLYALFELPPYDDNRGTVRFNPATEDSSVGEQVITGCIVDTGIQNLAAYGIEVTYPNSLVAPVSITAGASGMVPAGINTSVSGVITVAGIDVMGISPGSDLEIFVITWDTLAAGTANLELTINSLNDSATNPILLSTVQGAVITISE